MINHLAEHVIDMLYLINRYKESLKDGSHIESIIELLEHSSQVIVRDPRPKTDWNDKRLQQL